MHRVKRERYIIEAQRARANILSATLYKHVDRKFGGKSCRLARAGKACTSERVHGHESHRRRKKIEILAALSGSRWNLKTLRGSVRLTGTFAQIRANAVTEDGCQSPGALCLCCCITRGSNRDVFSEKTTRDEFTINSAKYYIYFAEARGF